MQPSSPKDGFNYGLPHSLPMAETDMYKKKSTDSMVLVIEFFNRPHEVGRLSTILILLNHSLEMLLKGILLKHDQDIRKENGHTIPFEECIDTLYNGTRDDQSLAMLSEEQKTTLEEIQAHRNEATHGNSILSEQRLYAYTRSGLSIFDSLLLDEFGEQLNDFLPNRVLPISGMPLKHLDIIYEEERQKIEKLLEQGAREAARAHVRSIESSNRTQEGSYEPPTNEELDDIIDRIESGDNFEDIFPGVANLSFGVEGDGPTIKLQFTKSEGRPVHQVSEEEAADDFVIGYREVNPFDRYSLGIQDLAQHVQQEVDVSWMKVWAIVREIDVHGNEDYHKVLTNSSGDEVDRYLPKSIDRIIEAVETDEVDPVKAWDKHGWV
jgi:hypothetical protein